MRTAELRRRIHDARKRVKEVRAQLRLFRDDLDGRFRELNHFYRDAGRELAMYRETDTVVAAVERIEGVSDAMLRRLKQLVRKEQRAAYRDRITIEATLENVEKKLSEARIPVAHKSTAKELKRTLRDGKRAMREAYDSANAIAFHEWRKRVKDLMHQNEFLAISKGQKRLANLSHLLGEHHDLDVVRGVVAAAETVFSQEEAAAIDEILRKRQSRLARKAKPIGEKIYG